MEMEALYFDLEEDDLMDEDGEAYAQGLLLALRSGIAGHDSSSLAAHRSDRERGSWKDTDATGGDLRPMKSIDGWVIFVSGLHEEMQQDDLYNAFGDFGQIKNIHLNIDRCTGFIKGYALIEYANMEEAEVAVAQMDGAELLSQIISVDWAFSNGPLVSEKFLKIKKKRGTHRRRSRSPIRRF